MLPLESRMDYWKMLVRQSPTGNPQVDKASMEEMRAALRDAILEIHSFQKKQTAALKKEPDRNVL